MYSWYSCGRILTNLADGIEGFILFVTIVFLSVFPLKICCQKAIKLVNVAYINGLELKYKYLDIEQFLYLSHHFLTSVVIIVAPVDAIISIWHLVWRYPLIKIAPSLCLNGCYLKICAKLNLNPLSAPFWLWWPWSTISKSLHYIRVFIEKNTHTCGVSQYENHD